MRTEEVDSWLESMLAGPVLPILLLLAGAEWVMHDPDRARRWVHAHVSPGFPTSTREAVQALHVGHVDPSPLSWALLVAAAVTAAVGALVVVVLRRRLSDQFPVG